RGWPEPKRMMRAVIWATWKAPLLTPLTDSRRPPVGRIRYDSGETIDEIRHNFCRHDDCRFDAARSRIRARKRQGLRLVADRSCSRPWRRLLPGKRHHHRIT